MSEIRFYNFEFVPLCIETEIISLYKTVYYNDVGIFEARISPFSKAFLKILNEPYLLAEEDKTLYIITAKQAGEECVVYGRTPNWFLTKRIVEPFTSDNLLSAGEISSKNIEDILRLLVSKSFTKDKGNFLLADKAGITLESDIRRLNYDSLYNVVTELLSSCSAGHRVYYDKSRKRWIFEIIKGRENPLIIGEAQKNSVSSEYIENALDYANVGVYEKDFEDMGNWDAENNEPTLLHYSPESLGKRYYVSNSGTQFGISFEKGDYAAYLKSDGYLYKCDGETGYMQKVLSDDYKDGIYCWEDALTSKTEETAKEELSGKRRQKEIETETDSLKLGEDYFLGDLVRVQKKIGNSFFTFQKRVIGTEYRLQNGVKSEKIIFGEI